MIYFDNSATTQPYFEVVSYMAKLSEHTYGNASSLHKPGALAAELVLDAKKAVAAAIGCSAREIYIGSGGTFLNNLAVIGGATALSRRGKRVVVTKIEHPSVALSAAKLSDLGFEVVLVSPDIESVERAVNEDTVLVSAMYVCNETGLILPVDKIKRIITRKGAPALFHIDAVQAFMKLDIDVAALGCDLLTVSAHKIGGPKGIGAIYIKKGVRPSPIIFGGAQEDGLVPGTYNSIAAAGFAKAIEIAAQEDKGHYKRLFTQIEQGLSGLNFVSFNTTKDSQAHHIMNISFDGYIGETVLHFFEMYDIICSEGAACSSKSKQKGQVLRALGYDDRRVKGAVRISFCQKNTPQEAAAFIKAATAVKDKLIRGY